MPSRWLLCTCAIGALIGISWKFGPPRREICVSTYEWMRPGEQRIVGEVDARHDVRRAERDLLGLGEEVVRVAVEHQPADRRAPAPAPRARSWSASSTSKLNLSACSSVKICTPSSHSGKAPASIASHRSRRWKSGSAPEIFTASSQSSECVPSTGFQWNLTKLDSPRGVDEPERVHAEALHHAVAARDRAVGHHPHQHVRRLGHQRDEVPERVVRGRRLRHGVVRLGLDRVDQVGKLHRVLDEEHRDVVADQVPVAFVGVELDREAAHVARRVGRAALADHGREAHEHRRALAGFGEERRARVLRQRLRSTRSSRARPSRARARCARGCARGRSA